MFVVAASGAIAVACAGALRRQPAAKTASATAATSAIAASVAQVDRPWRTRAQASRTRNHQRRGPLGVWSIATSRSHDTSDHQVGPTLARRHASYAALGITHSWRSCCGSAAESPGSGDSPARS